METFTRTPSKASSATSRPGCAVPTSTFRTSGFSPTSMSSPGGTTTATGERCSRRCLVEQRTHSVPHSKTGPAGKIPFASAPRLVRAVSAFGGHRALASVLGHGASSNKHTPPSRPASLGGDSDLFASACAAQRGPLQQILELLALRNGDLDRLSGLTRPFVLPLGLGLLLRLLIHGRGVSGY